MANSLQADLIGSKIMRQLRKEAEKAGTEVYFFGYGGRWMA